MEKQPRFCQSCGMPLPDEGALDGTAPDGSKNPDYCIYCYRDGAFIADCTMDEMIEFCIPHLRASCPDLTEAQARADMTRYFPQLKRWAGR